MLRVLCVKKKRAFHLHIICSSLTALPIPLKSSMRVKSILLLKFKRKERKEVRRARKEFSKRELNYFHP
jgi:hypothetical protein